jgi:uncharacterized protein (TIGR02231 family)
VTQEVVANKPTINISMSPDIQQLQEVVVSALEGRVAGVQVRGTSSRAKYEEDDQEVFSIIETSVVKTQTNVEIELDIPYSIKSDGESYSVDLKDIEIPSTYEYYAVPKMDPDVFLVAKITNWNNYNLLQGDANLYFEGTFIGKTILDVNNFSDTLEVSLGRDKNVLVKKDREIEFSKSRSVGGNKLDTRVYKITVRNNKSSSIYLTVFDQIPVPVINSISVDPIDIPDNILNENTGIIKWTTLVEPQGKSEIQFGYEVKYPKNESVILD